MNHDGPFRVRQDGLDIRLRLTPRGGEDAVTGVTTTADGRRHVAARVRAAPEAGAANAAVEALVARWLGLPRRDVKVAGGQSSRLKALHVAGDPDALRARLESLLGTHSGNVPD